VSDTSEKSGSELEATAGFDDVLDRLRGVVGRLEQGNLSLEDSLRAYEEGVGLARRGHELLDKAEKRVELLVSAREGTIEATPLDEGDPGGRDAGA
jgi:exodeoxyribonuclease VII small subunit